MAPAIPRSIHPPKSGDASPARSRLKNHNPSESATLRLVYGARQVCPAISIEGSIRRCLALRKTQRRGSRQGPALPTCQAVLRHYVAKTRRWRQQVPGPPKCAKTAMSEIRALPLTPNERAAFERDGFLRLGGAFPDRIAHGLAERAWTALKERHGIDPTDRTTWRWDPGRRLHGAKNDWRHREIATARLTGAINDILGESTWQPPQSWGSVMVTFPNATEPGWTVPAKIWHWDSRLPDNAAAPTNLTTFTYLNDVGPKGGGTLVVQGSHRLLKQFHGRLKSADRARDQRWHRQRFMRSHPWLLALSSEGQTRAERIERFMVKETMINGIGVRVVELCGEAGDAILCHPLLLHAASQNASDRPRLVMMKIIPARSAQG